MHRVKCINITKACPFIPTSHISKEREIITVYLYPQEHDNIYKNHHGYHSICVQEEGNISKL